MAADFNATDRFWVGASVRTQVLDEELVVLDLRQGEYYSLNPAAAAVWRALAEGRDLAGIEEAAAEWPVPAEEQQRLIRALLTDLIGRGLITRQP